MKKNKEKKTSRNQKYEGWPGELELPVIALTARAFLPRWQWEGLWLWLDDGGWFCNIVYDIFVGSLRLGQNGSLSEPLLDNKVCSCHWLPLLPSFSFHRSCSFRPLFLGVSIVCLTCFILSKTLSGFAPCCALECFSQFLLLILSMLLHFATHGCRIEIIRTWCVTACFNCLTMLCANLHIQFNKSRFTCAKYTLQTLNQFRHWLNLTGHYLLGSQCSETESSKSCQRIKTGNISMFWLTKMW